MKNYKNEATRRQIQNFLDEAVKNRNTPNKREQVKKMRVKKIPKVMKQYGF